MQVSVYVKDALSKKIDAFVKKKGLSRSRLIEDLLERFFGNGKAPSAFDEVFGIMTPRQVGDLLDNIKSSRKNSSRFRP